ncbi:MULTISPECIES: MarR family winged helix-turn-helix transcriptional regulator [Thermomonospora]|uniref:DNA-binding MarR family transcriptional regulator n=1 Tax=Thermomonospora cellulosilytica TaxID=1411118 RepID=A0A7W3MZQ5_9ACTN|nr:MULTISPECIES: MarR family transcriptional regulator [Thermomonospora]MBA9004878.1 DNA-binding MarR family transcriptional regulator [Thermomonospora cellulosilytica]
MQPNPSVEELADGLGGLITYLMKSAEGDIFRDFLRLDLSPSQIRALFLVERAPSPLAVHELAAELQLSMAATGRAVDALVRHGLAERHEDSGDRRVKRISATPAGHELVAQLYAARREDMRRFAASLTEEERTGLVKALAPILARPEIRALTIGPFC